MLLQIPQEFFTVQSIITLTGATVATFVIANGIQMAFNFNPKWLALIIAIILSLFGVYESHLPDKPHLLSDYFIGIINGFLIYCTAVGASQIAAPKTENKQKEATRRLQPNTTKRTFFSPWF